MRRFIGYAALAMIGMGLTAACAASTEETEDTSSAEAALGASAVGGATTKGALATIDLSRPDVAMRFEPSKGTVDLTRVKVLDGRGGGVLLSELVQTAEKSSGLTTPPGGFVLRSAPATIKWPGPGKCSWRTQTDCCECGYWIGGLCAGLWCPVFSPF